MNIAAASVVPSPVKSNYSIYDGYTVTASAHQVSNNIWREQRIGSQRREQTGLILAIEGAVIVQVGSIHHAQESPCNGFLTQARR